MSILKEGIQLTKKGIILDAILFSVFFTFYFIFSLNVLPKIASPYSEPWLLQVVFNFAIAGMLLASSYLIKRIMKMRLIFVSAIITSALTFLLVFVSNYVLASFLVFFIGVFFSICQLSFFLHFWHTTSNKERGRIGGIIGCTALMLFAFMTVIIESGIGFSETIMIAVALTMVPAVAMLPRLQRDLLVIDFKSAKEETYPESRTVIFYAIPWVIFSLINMTLSKNIAANMQQSVDLSIFMMLFLLQTFGAFAGALFGGIVADFFGRRSSLMLSVTLYGVSMALSGFVQDIAVSYFVYVANGFSWGILLTLYSFVVWGDLSNKENCAKMYSIGLVIFYISIAIGQIPTFIPQISVVISAFVGCMLIFLSNLPVVLAPELSSSDFKEKLKIKMHIKTAKKVAAQYEN